MGKPSGSAVGGVLESLPWRVRARIRARAFWGVCPAGVQGALVWAALSPLLWPILALLTRLDPVGNYPLRWGGATNFLIMWLPGLALSATFLPAARGVAALRKGGLWWEHAAALRGVDPASNKRVETAFGEWALFAWMWALAVFVSWLEERSMREGGATLGHAVAWHVFNVARVEVCAWIFLTLAVGCLSMAKVFGPNLGALSPPTVGSERPKADWSKLPRGVGTLWRATKTGAAAGWGRQAAAYSEPLSRGASRWQAWGAWWRQAPFFLRALSMASCAGLAWAGANEWALASGLDPEWAGETIGEMSLVKLATVVGMCAIMARLVSRQAWAKRGSSLWFGPAGPSGAAWARFALAGVALDRILALRMSLSGECVSAGVAGGGFFVAVMSWVGLVWMGEFLGWAGGFFDAWGARAKKRGGNRLGALARVAALAMADSWRAAGAASGRLAEAVERKAMENEFAVAQAQREELAEAIPEPVKSRPRSNRL